MTYLGSEMKGLSAEWGFDGADENVYSAILSLLTRPCQAFLSSNIEESSVVKRFSTNYAAVSHFGKLNISSNRCNLSRLVARVSKEELYCKAL